MEGRILDVTARTTFDFLDAEAQGLGWRDDGASALEPAVDADPGRPTRSRR